VSRAAEPLVNDLYRIVLKGCGREIATATIGIDFLQGVLNVSREVSTGITYIERHTTGREELHVLKETSVETLFTKSHSTVSLRGIIPRM